MRHGKTLALSRTLSMAEIRKEIPMNRNDILDAIKMLAQSQGLYGRILRELYELDEESFDAVMTEFEKQNFKDVVDLVMFIEC